MIDVEKREVEWKSGVKVVRKLGGGYLSVVVCYSDIARVRYVDGEISKRCPRCGPMAVFQTVAHAADFAEQEGVGLRNWENNLRILPCLYKPSAEQTLYCFVEYGFTPLGRRQGNEYLGDRFKSMTDDFPPGTAFADEVMVLEPLEGSDEYERAR